MNDIERLECLKHQLDGELHSDKLHKILYSTDASSYRETPSAVIIPKTTKDIKRAIQFAIDTRQTIIPRAAGTSLAGQVVGSGIVVDCSKYMNQILEFNEKERWIRVQPGVNLTELNNYLAQYNLQFGPETSTANRCCLGGMLGNNSCGARSLIYGSVRDHILEVDCILSDTTEVTFKDITKEELNIKRKDNPDLLETRIYDHLYRCMMNPVLRREIQEAYPEKEVKRRNMGYAIDALLDSEPFGGGKPFNVAKLLAGSEGTLAFTTSMKLNLVPLPPKHGAVIVMQFESLQASLEANIIALQYKPDAVEMMDDKILECTKENITQRKNRFFLEGDPKVVLVAEFSRESKEEIEVIYQFLTSKLKEKDLGYHFTLLFDKGEIRRVWELRKAGLGLLSNIPGDKRSTTVIEDTAVSPYRLPQYIKEFNEILQKYDLSCVHYAHVATGELHLRPLLDLKTEKGQELYETIATEIAALVKKHKGSLSGEHGDGRLRGAFIPFMYGNEIYKLFRKIKTVWDPEHIMNPGKIIDAPIITKDLRYDLKNQYNDLKPVSSFRSTLGFLRAIEKCNGSGDCRKSKEIGGGMCPTYMVSRDEKMSTRGRANVIREFLHHSTSKNPLDHPEVMEILNQCISCKACKSECPSNVDMAKIKAEVLQSIYSENGAPLRSKLIAYLPRLNPIAQAFRVPTNAVLSKIWFKRMVGFHPDSTIPLYTKQTLTQWNKKQEKKNKKQRAVYLLADEFINYQESEIGKKAIILLEQLGYNVKLITLKESGRTLFSKGFMKEGQKVARANVNQLQKIIQHDEVIVGLEPSTILSFRDEYIDLVKEKDVEKAKELANVTLLFEEFFVKEYQKGHIKAVQFKAKSKEVLVHGHCQQKAVASTKPLIQMLASINGCKPKEINSGCCGMAGSFGYEKEHYELSKQIGEMTLFPAVREADEETTIVAPGTSCRHHIEEGTGRKAIHPVEYLLQCITN